MALETWLLPAGYEGQPIAYVIVAILAFLMTGVSKGGFGGVGALAIPMMMLVAPSKLAIGMWLPLLIFCDILTMRAYPSEWKLRPIALLAPWMAGGIALGALLLSWVQDWQVKLLVGGLAVGFVVLDVFRNYLAKRVASSQQQKPWEPTWLTASPFGLTGGVCTMIAHAAGPVTTIYLLPQRLDKRTFVGTSARFYFVFNSFKVPFFLHPDLNLINRESLIKSLWLVPLAPLSIWLGSWLNRKLSAKGFGKVIYVLLVISGLYLVYANTIGREPAQAAQSQPAVAPADIMEQEAADSQQ